METYVVAYGGSIVIPGDAYDERLMTELANFLQKHKDKKFVLIIGGGNLARKIISTTKPILIDANLSSTEIDTANDELGIAITKINARRVISSLQSHLGEDIVCETYIDNPEIIPETKHQIYIASGFKPGVTTDYCMIRLAKSFKANKLFKISNFKQILKVKPTEFDKNKIETYEKISKISWKEINELVGDEFIPGGHFPLDPPAAKLGLELSLINKEFKLSVGQQSEFEKMIEEKEFIGTVIKND